MKVTNYYNHWSHRIFTFLFTLIFFGMSIILLGVLITILSRWILGINPTNMQTKDIISLSIGFTAAAMVTGFIGAIFANAKPNVRVSDKGLEVQDFLFWWNPISWEDIKDIRSIPIIGGSRTRLVVVRNLTFIHRVIGTIYFAFFQPAFLISSTLDNYDELVHLIKKKIGKESWE